MKEISELRPIYRAGQAAHNFYARTAGKVLTNAFGDIF